MLAKSVRTDVLYQRGWNYRLRLCLGHLLAVLILYMMFRGMSMPCRKEMNWAKWLAPCERSADHESGRLVRGKFRRQHLFAISQNHIPRTITCGVSICPLNNYRHGRV